MQTIHFVYTIPTSNNRIYYRIDKYARKYGIFEPTYRSGNQRFINWGHPTYAPHSITFHILNALRKQYKVKLYDWREVGTCNMQNDDVLLFHPTPDFAEWQRFNTWHIDENSIGWKTLLKYPDCKSIVIAPYTHEAHKDVLFRRIFESYTDKMIVICGDFWTNTWHESPYFKLIPLPLQVNMGIDMRDYPIVKKKFNPANERKFLYIGNTGIWKNTVQLEKIAKQYPNFQGGYISSGIIDGWKKIADFAHLTKEFMTELALEYDFFLNTSTADAQATTVLEQMCFGLGVACTPQSGYSYPSVIKLSTYDTEYNLTQIAKMQSMQEAEICDLVAENRKMIVKYHQWDGILNKIITYLENGYN